MKKLGLAGAAQFFLASLMLIAGQSSASAAAANALVWGRPLPRNLDPQVASDLPIFFISLNVYDSLYRYEGKSSEIQPWLVQNKTVSDDGKTWQFELRHGVKFHDGHEMTADDVVYSFKRVLTLGKSPASAFKGILKPENVTKTGQYTVKFVLDEPYAPFLASLPLVSIVNAGLVQAHVTNDDWGQAWLSQHDAGSGAYTFDTSTYAPNSRLDLTRFKEFFLGWSDNPAAFDLIRARPVLDPTSRVLALLKGDIDISDEYLPVDQVEKVQQSKLARVIIESPLRILLIRMNNSKPPFDNVHFRRCLSYAFNYEGFIKDVQQGYATRLTSPIPEGLWATREHISGYGYDMAKAKEECAQAKTEGAPTDRSINVNFVAELPGTRQVAELLQSGAREVGVTLKVVPDTWSHVTASTGSAKTTPDMWVHFVSAYTVDPENWIGQMYGSKFAGTWKASSWYHNQKVDSLLDHARSSLDQEKRKQLYGEAAKEVVSDAPDIWIANLKQTQGVSKRVEGLRFTPVGGISELRWAHSSGEGG